MPDLAAVGRTWDGEPFLATTRDEVLEAAGSRCTYAANPLAMREAERRGLASWPWSA